MITKTKATDVIPLISPLLIKPKVLKQTVMTGLGSV